MKIKTLKIKKNKKYLKGQTAKLKKLLITSISAAALVAFICTALYNYKFGPESNIDLRHVDRSHLVKGHSPAAGTDSAQVTIVEFFDPACELSRFMHGVLKIVSSEYGDKVKIVHRYLPEHENSEYAIAALEETRPQGKYEEALEVLFNKQHIWGNHETPRPDLIAVFLSQMGFDKVNFDKEDVLRKHSWKIDLDKEDVRKLGIRKSPTFFINGKIELPQNYEQMKSAINRALQVKGDSGDKKQK